MILYDLDAEEAVLGSVLLDPDAFRSLAFLSSGDFYRDRNRWVFTAFVEIDHRHEPVNQVSVAHELTRQGRLDAMGGSDYLSHLVLNCATSVHAEHYGRIVKRLSTYRALLKAGEDIQRLASQNPPDEVETVSKAHDIISTVEVAQKTGFSPVGDIVEDVFTDVDRQLENGFERGLMTGFTKLDDTLRGFAPGDLVVIAARPGVGKSWKMTALAKNIARRGEGVGIISLEMTKKELVKRIVFSDAGVNEAQLGRKIRENLITIQEKQDARLRISDSIYKVKDLPIYISDKPKQTTADIRHQAMKMAGIKILFIDHLQLVADRGDNEIIRIGRITQELKNLAKELSIPVVMLCQLSRQAEGVEPKLDHLRWSGDIEQNADTVLGLYRPFLHNEQANEHDMKVICLKYRHGPSIWSVHLYWDDGRLSDWKD